MNDEIVSYPVILHEIQDEDGHYFGIDSPNIDGFVTDGDTRAAALEYAVDAIATMIEGDSPYAKPQNPADWKLNPGESVEYVTINMTQWLRDKN